METKFYNGCEKQNVMTQVPPIKSQGIKTKLVPWIQSIVPQNFEGRWIEPFMGTGVVAFNIAPKHDLLCDTNPHLINFYSEIKIGKITAPIVRKYLEKEGANLLEKEDEHYYAIRERFNEKHSPLDFLFLNRAGYACNECGKEITSEKLTGWYTKKTVERQKEKLIKELNNIYIVHLKDNIFKIGIAKNPSTRLCGIKTGSMCVNANYNFILELSTYDAFYLECMIHKKLKPFRYKWEFAWKGHTECFILDKDQLEKIKEIMIEYRGNI